MKRYLLIILSALATCSVVPNPVAISFGVSPTIEALLPISDYAIYTDEATLPTLYSSLTFLSHDKPSYFYSARAGAINTTRVPPHVKVLSSDAELKDKIAELNATNPNSTFTFYMNDLRLAKLQMFFYSQGISADRVRAIMLSDGTATYAGFTDNYLSQDAFSKWNQAKRRVLDTLSRPTALSDKDEFIPDGTFLTGPDVSSNIEFWMQWPELLSTSSDELRRHLETTTGKYYKVQPSEYYDLLPSAKQEDFQKLVGLDKSWAKGEGNGTLNNQTILEALNDSPNPNIIIVGTNPFGNQTDKYIAQVKNKYGDKFDYFFKAHPADSTNPADTTITVFPNRLPMEAILFAYSDNIAVLGGYESSLFMSAPTKIEKFFFPKRNGTVTSPENLLSPLNGMYQKGILGKVEFIR
ncbi:MAG: hypothetical protein ACRC9L_01005 [Brevinema sp.]